MHLGEPLPQDRPTFQFDFPVLVLFFLLTFIFMTVTNGVGASTGMFVPALAVGAAGGRIMGRIVMLIVRCELLTTRLQITGMGVGCQFNSADALRCCSTQGGWQPAADFADVVQRGGRGCVHGRRDAYDADDDGDGDGDHGGAAAHRADHAHCFLCKGQ